MRMETQVVQDNCYEFFDTEAYVRQRFPVPIEAADNRIHSHFLLKCLSRHFSSTTESGQVILDYGCGPSIAFSISAASKASEIVLAEYLPQNREFLQKWLCADPSAHDWSPYFKYVVQALEGAPEREVVQREKDLRSKVKALVPCDMTKKKFIDESYISDSFDTVMCFLILDGCCKDFDAFKVGLKKLSSLVKKGGHLLLLTTRRENCDIGFYVVKGQKFYDVALKRDSVVEAIKQNGFNIVDEDYLQLLPNDIGNSEGFLFFAACKNID